MESSSLKFPISARKHTKYREIISTLPQTNCWGQSMQFYEYLGFWFSPTILEGTMSAQEHFIAQPTDILISSFPKSGTTWLKSLCFAILTRSQYFNDDFVSPNHPLLTNVPHDVIPFIEVLPFNGSVRDFEFPLLSTHIPYNCLPKSVTESKCKIIYIYRDPKDVLISSWHFSFKIAFSDLSKTASEIFPLDKAFEKFCEGVFGYGPYWDHVLGYWKTSLEFPDRILFIKYEDLMTDCYSYVKRLAEFMGCPFSAHEEERRGLVLKITNFCCFDSLSNLEVNKSNKLCSTLLPIDLKIENNAYFRKGKVGDWENYLTPEMAARIDKITEQKFGGWGLTF